MGENCFTVYSSMVSQKDCYIGRILYINIYYTVGIISYYGYQERYYCHRQHILIQLYYYYSYHYY